MLLPFLPRRSARISRNTWGELTTCPIFPGKKRKKSQRRRRTRLTSYNGANSLRLPRERQQLASAGGRKDSSAAFFARRLLRSSPLARKRRRVVYILECVTRNAQTPMRSAGSQPPAPERQLPQTLPHFSCRAPLFSRPPGLLIVRDSEALAPAPRVTGRRGGGLERSPLQRVLKRAVSSGLKRWRNSRVQRVPKWRKRRG